jgi:inorganic pyrophosphatase
VNGSRDVADRPLPLMYTLPMHPWHDIYVDDHTIAKVFPVVIEVPMGSKNKYELDKESGLMKLDRVLYSAVHYPANYGFIPRTFCDDGDPLDALVLGQEPVHPATVVEARAIVPYFSSR